MPRAASKLVPVVFRAGVKFSGDPSEQYTRVFALTPAPAHSVNAALTAAAAIFFCMDVSLLGCLFVVPDDGCRVRARVYASGIAFSAMDCARPATRRPQ